jgi:hypothetical protein
LGTSVQTTRLGEDAKQIIRDSSATPVTALTLSEAA